MHVVVHDVPMRCKLDTVFQAYLNSPHRLDDIVDVHLSALRQVPLTPPPPTEKEAA